MSDVQSHNSKFSHGSGSSNSKVTNSTQMGFSKRIKEKIFEVFLNFNTGRSFFGESMVLPLFEVIFCLEMVFFMMKMCLPVETLFNHDLLPSWYWWFYVYLDPSLITTSTLSFMIMFLTTLTITILCFSVFLFVYYVRTSNDIICGFCFFYFRMTRCLFLFPLLSILTSPLRCRFLDGSFSVYLHESSSCLAFPFLLFSGIGLLCVCIVVFVSFSDAFLFLDKFRSVRLWSSSPDGRFNIIVLEVLFFIVICDWLSFQMNHIIDVICSCLMVMMILFLLLVAIRFVPYYHIQATVVSSLTITSMLVLAIQRLIIVVLSSSTSSSATLVSLGSLIPMFVSFYIFVLISLLVRYFLLFVYFGKKLSKKNVFVCFFPADISIGIFLNQEKERLLSLLSFKKKTIPQSHVDVNIKTIMDLLRNDEFKKNKLLCHMMISLVIEKRPTLALSILNHTKTILSDGLPDEEMALQFYRNRITNIQEVGKRKEGKGKDGTDEAKHKKALLMTELERSRKREIHLNQLLLFLFRELNSDDGKVSFSRFPKLLSSIQINQEFCENIYSKMVKSHPSPLTFRRYARYLSLYTGNQSVSNMYLKEANQLEQIEGSLNSPSLSDFQHVSSLKNNYREEDKSERYENEEKMEEEIELEEQNDDDDDDDGDGDGDDQEKEEEYEDDDDDCDEIDEEKKENLPEILCEESSFCEEEKSDESSEEESEMKSVEEDDPKLLNVVSTEDMPQIKTLKDITSRSSGSLTLLCVKKGDGSDDSEDSEDEQSNNSAIRKSVHTSSQVMDGYKSRKQKKREEDEYSFRGGGSVLTSSSVIFNEKGNGIRKKLFRKVEKAVYLSTLSIRVICILFFLLSVGGVVLMFVLSFLMKGDFTSSVMFVEKMTRMEKAISEVAHFTRKLQISYYPENLTPFEFERNSSVFRALQKEHCEKIRARTLYVYKSVSDEEKSPLVDTMLNVTYHMEKANEDSAHHEYGYREWSVMDAILNYVDSCEKMSQLPDSAFGLNHSVGDRIQDNEDFFFLLENEPVIKEGVRDALSDFNEEEEEESIMYIFFFYLVPSLLVVVIVPLFLCSYVCFWCEQRRSFQGFFFIPKSQLQKLIEKYSMEQRGEEIEYQHHQKTRKGKEKDEDEGIFNKFEENRTLMSGSKTSISSIDDIRVDTVKFSILQQFMITSCSFLAVLVAAIMVFTVLGHIVCSEFVSRNNEYDNTLELSAYVNRLHFWNTELVYRNDSLFTDEEVIENIEEDCLRMERTFDALRYGKYKETFGLGGNDGRDGFFEIYYEDTCKDLTEEKLNDELESLKCRSLSQKIEYLTHASMELIESNYSDISIRGSDEYKEIILLDNLSNGTLHQDDSAIEGDLLELRNLVYGSLNDHFSYFQNLLNLFLFMFLPIYALLFCALMRNYPKRLTRNMSTTRRILLLMDAKSLANPNVHDFITKRSSFGKAFDRQQKNRLETIFDVLNSSSNGFICFSTKEGRIIRYNKAANELFRIRESGAECMRDILTQKSLIEIQKWKRKKRFRSQHSFHKEVLAIYEDQETREEFPVLADICIDEECSFMIGIFENMESSKQKDFMKESERRTEEIDFLFQNILPKDIASTMKIDEFRNGKCVVYRHKKATAYFCDICNFTGMSTKTDDPEDIINVLHGFYCGCDNLCERYKLEKIKTIGDCYFCVSGIPQYKPLHAVTAMKFAIAVLKFTVQFNQKNGCRLQIRTGMSSGELVAGIVGTKKRAYDIWGPMINEAARMESNGLPGKIQVSRSTYESLFERYEFLEREIQLQGIGVSVKAYLYTPDFSTSTSSSSPPPSTEGKSKKDDKKKE